MKMVVLSQSSVFMLLKTKQNKTKTIKLATVSSNPLYSQKGGSLTCGDSERGDTYRAAEMWLEYDSQTIPSIYT
jgi:hypothetical protein